jgi:hypothetical protein
MVVNIAQCVKEYYPISSSVALHDYDTVARILRQLRRIDAEFEILCDQPRAALTQKSPYASIDMFTSLSH